MYSIQFKSHDHFATTLSFFYEKKVNLSKDRITENQKQNNQIDNALVLQKAWDERMLMHVFCKTWPNCNPRSHHVCVKEWWFSFILCCWNMNFNFGFQCTNTVILTPFDCEWTNCTSKNVVVVVFALFIGMCILNIRIYIEIEYFLMTLYYRFLIILSLIIFLDYFTRAVMTDIVLLHMFNWLFTSIAYFYTVQLALRQNIASILKALQNEKLLKSQ